MRSTRMAPDGKPDPDYDLADPASKVNRSAVQIPAVEQTEAPTEEQATRVQDDLALGNVLLYRKPHPAFPEAAAVVHAEEGIIYLRDPAALPKALASYALSTVGESNPMLATPVAPDIAKALNKQHASQVWPSLSGLLEDEIGRRLSGAPSLFANQGHWLPVLADDMADMAENHLDELLRHRVLVRRSNRLELAPRSATRELAPQGRSISPADSLPWEKALSMPAVPAALKARLDKVLSADQAIQEIRRAVDAGEVSDPDFDRVERILARSAAEHLPHVMFPGAPSEEASRQIHMGLSMDSAYFHDVRGRIYNLQTMGIPGMHLAHYDMMNLLTAARQNGGSYVNTMAAILSHGSSRLFKLETDPKTKARYLNRRKETALTKSQRQILMRYEAAVTALMQMSDHFDTLDEATFQDLINEEGTIVYGQFRPRFKGDKRAGDLPESESIAAVLEDFNREVRPLLLDADKGGRTADEIDLRKLAQGMRNQYIADVQALNDTARDFLDGRNFLSYRHNYAPQRYGWAPAVDPDGEAADRDIMNHLRYADLKDTLLKTNDGTLEPAAKERHENGVVPPWSQTQQDLLRKYDRRTYANAMAADEKPNVAQANRMLMNALRKKLYRSAAEHYSKGGEHPGEWKPTTEEEKQMLATVRHLMDILKNYRFVEFSRAEFPRVFKTYKEAYEETKKSGDPLVPRTMSFIDLRAEYLERTYAAAMNKAVMNSFLLMTDPTGRPLVMAKPVGNVSLTHGVILPGTWAKYASNLARYYGDRFDPNAAPVTVHNPDGSVKHVVPGTIAEVRRLYDLYSGKHEAEVIRSPKTASIEQWAVANKDAARLLKKLVQVSPTEIYPLARLLQSALAWTKQMSFAFSAFFQTALGESALGMSGPGRKNLLWQAMFNRKEFMEFWKSVRAFREHRRYYNPEIAGDLEYMLKSGLTTGQTAILEPYVSIVQRDMQQIGAFVDEKYGHGAAEAMMTFMFGKDDAKGIAKAWPGVTGRKFSVWMFDWFSAVKEAQMDLAVKRLAAENGLTPEGHASWSQVRYLSKYFNDGMGGQNWAAYLWATPQWMFGLNLALLAPNWTLSSWNTSGMAPLSQALFKNYPAPGQQRFIWTHYMPSMFLWTMAVVPAMLQAAAYGVGKLLGGDPDDVPFPWMNEPGRKQYIDMTPIMRHAPFYKGDPTGKRRIYIQFAKQVHETGLSNPFGTRGWINEPWNQFLRKMPMPVRALYEQLTGTSPGSDWQMEFAGKGMLGIFNSGEPGLKGFMTSRLGYIAQKLMPMSTSQFLQNPETFPLNHFAPTSKGAPQSKIVKNIASVLATYASAKDWHRIRQVPRARAALDSLVPEFLRAAQANGYNPDKVLSTAKGMVLGDLYARMWKALDTMDEPLMRETAASIWRVGGALKGLRSSMANKQRSFGIELTPEQMQAAEDAMQWAMYGSE
jgi:hypothetical protein